MPTAISPEMARALSNSAAKLNPPAALKQYKAYRSAPDRFPSYDRMQFVRLPDEMLPPSLRRDDRPVRDRDGPPTRLTHWPAILYATLHECIRDLPRDADAILKARLVVDHNAFGPRRVARLIGWRGVAEGDGDGGEAAFFPDTSVDLIRLQGEEGGDPTEGEVLPFCEHQFDLEGLCRSAIRGNGGFDGSGERPPSEILQYARKWKKALAMALNILAVDVGQAAVPLKDEPVENSKEARRETTDECGISDRVEAVKEGKGKRKALGDISNRPHNKIKIKRKGDRVTATDVSVQIAPRTPWKSVWKTLRASGWTWKGGSGLMMDYFYVRPGRKVKGGQVGVDYFTSEQDVKDFCKKEYGWIGPQQGDEEEVKGKEKEKHVPRAAAPSLDNHNSCVTDSDTVDDEDVPPLVSPIHPHSSWRSAWAKMRQSGWTWKEGTGLMMDYYYVKPGKRIKGGKPGVDYFVDRKSVEEFMKRCYGWLGETDDGETESMESDDESLEEKKPDMVTLEVKKMHSKSAKSNNSSVQHKSEVAPCRSSNIADGPSESSSFVPDFKDLWSQLKEEGWTVIKAGKYNRLHDWYWVRPGCDPGDVTTRLGEHYFLSEEDVMDFVKNTKAATAADLTTEKKSKPQANGKTLSFNKSDEASESSSFVPDFKDLWSQLKEEGWTVIKAGKYNRLHDWYWIRPGCDPGDVTTRLGEHYFLSEEDVMDFIKNAKVTTAADVKTEKKSKPQANGKTLSSNKADKPSESSSFIPDWADLWHQLKQEGWTAIKAGKYNRLHDWYWVRPGCDPGHPSSILGQDYFLSMEDVIEFVKHLYRSNENSRARFERENELSVKSFDDSPKKKESVLKPPNPVRSQHNQPLTPIDCKTKPQDPAVPLPFSPDSVTSTNSQEIYDWNNLWPTLQKAGWKVIRAGKFNILHDWYYVRPNRDPADKNCKLGSHYFTTPDDVIQYVKMVDEESGSMGGKLGRKSIDVMLAAFEKEAENIGTKGI